jgi:hypothetical protein
MGLLLTGLIKLVVIKYSRFGRSAAQSHVGRAGSLLYLWTFSVTVGVLSHLGFDLISHDTNLLLYPWVPDAHWFPHWWYTPWFVIGPPLSMGPAYFVGIHTVIWLILTIVGTFLFYQFVFQRMKACKNGEAVSPQV